LDCCGHQAVSYPLCPCGISPTFLIVSTRIRLISGSLLSTDRQSIAFQTLTIGPFKLDCQNLD
jgi:hypothetical protein